MRIPIIDIYITVRRGRTVRAEKKRIKEQLILRGKMAMNLLNQNLKLIQRLKRWET